MHTKKKSRQLNTWNVFYMEVSPPTSITKKWLSQKWLNVRNYHKFFSSEKFLGILAFTYHAWMPPKPLFGRNMPRNSPKVGTLLVNPEWVKHHVTGEALNTT